MTSTDLVARGDELDTTRQDALEQLQHAAEIAATPQEAREAMLKAKVYADLLARLAAPFEESRLAGKASTTAARRLGRMLGELSAKAATGRYGGGGEPSERGLARRELNIRKTLAQDLVRLGQVNDPDFQRYIQQSDRVPSINGALRACAPERRRPTPTANVSWRSARRRKCGVKTPPNPSFDEGYSLIVKALGHLSASAEAGSPKQKTAVAAALDLIYEAEDLLRPYRGGYVA